jgi:hypothetical protein
VSCRGEKEGGECGNNVFLAKKTAFFEDKKNRKSSKQARMVGYNQFTRAVSASEDRHGLTSPIAMTTNQEKHISKHGGFYVGEN